MRVILVPKLNMDEKGNSLNYIIYLPVAQQIITSQPEELFPSDLLNHYIYLNNISNKFKLVLFVNFCKSYFNKFDQVFDRKL
jgi:hypothetical protein